MPKRNRQISSQRRTENGRSGAAAKFGAWIQANPWLGTAIVFIVGVVFGSGSIWKYLEIKKEHRALDLQSTVIANEMQDRLRDVQVKIISSVPPYVAARDNMFSKRAEDRNSEDGRAWSNTKASLLNWIEEYNRVEARLSVLERRQPHWFDVGIMLPPMPPQNLQIGGSENTAKLSWEYMQDPLLKELHARLINIYKDYGQIVTAEASVTVEVTPPTESGTAK